MAKISRYEQALSLIYWDLETYAPENSVNYRSEVLGELSERHYNLFVSDTIAEYLDYFHKKTFLIVFCEQDKALIKVTKKRIRKKIKKIPVKLVRKLAQTTTKANHAWKKKQKNVIILIFFNLI